MCSPIRSNCSVQCSLIVLIDFRITHRFFLNQLFYVSRLGVNMKVHGAVEVIRPLQVFRGGQVKCWNVAHRGCGAN